MGALVLRPSDLGDAAVGRNDQHGRQIRLQRAVQPRETLHVQHVDFINEQDARHNGCLALFTPLSDLGVDLITNLRLDLASVAYIRISSTFP